MSSDAENTLRMTEIVIRKTLARQPAALLWLANKPIGASTPLTTLFTRSCQNCRSRYLGCQNRYRRYVGCQNCYHRYVGCQNHHKVMSDVGINAPVPRLICNCQNSWCVTIFSQNRRYRQKYCQNRRYSSEACQNRRRSRKPLVGSMSESPVLYLKRPNHRYRYLGCQNRQSTT